MKSSEISQIVKHKSSNLTELAEAVGVAPSHVHNVIYRKVVSRPVAIKIAKALEVDFDKAFPEYIKKDQERLARRQRVANLAKLVNS